ncbi:hypothetical protein AGMMS4956_18690 [Bacteroidia bacterium]|nr:hypothetical protein AGMMS4956_18690 [Bacteroidia bacterium]
MKTNVIQRFTALGYAVLVGTAVMAQGVSIGDKDFTPNPAAILDVRASNKGVLIPRVTYTERMYIQTNSQSTGLLVYQTDWEATNVDAVNFIQNKPTHLITTSITAGGSLAGTRKQAHRYLFALSSHAGGLGEH